MINVYEELKGIEELEGVEFTMIETNEPARMVHRFICKVVAVDPGLGISAMVKDENGAITNDCEYALCINGPTSPQAKADPVTYAKQMPIDSYIAIMEYTIGKIKSGTIDILEWLKFDSELSGPRSGYNPEAKNCAFSQ